jgi:hypothetical protein
MPQLIDSTGGGDGGGERAEEDGAATEAVPAVPGSVSNVPNRAYMPTPSSASTAVTPVTAIAIRAPPRGHCGDGHRSKCRYLRKHEQTSCHRITIGESSGASPVRSSAGMTDKQALSNSTVMISLAA